MIKKIVLLCAFLALGGCKKYSISPDTLPTAHINQPYQQKILIEGGKTADQSFDLITTLPNDFGITAKPDDSNGYNEIIVRGIPRYKGNFKIHVVGGFYAGGGALIDKKYIFTVTD